MQDALGKSLEEICKIVPAGALVFFPSYKMMEKLSNRWRETGQWSRLNSRKPLFVGNTFNDCIKKHCALSVPSCIVLETPHYLASVLELCFPGCLTGIPVAGLQITSLS